MQSIQVDATITLTLIWSISSFFIGLFLGIFIDELKQIYKDRGRITLTGKKIDLLYETFDQHGNPTSTMNGSPMLKKAEMHLAFYNNSRRTRTIRNLQIVGKVKNGEHFKIDFSQGKVPPSIVVNQKEIKEITLSGEFEALTNFIPLFPDLLTIELIYENDNGDAQFIQFRDSEIAIIEEPTYNQWQIF